MGATADDVGSTLPQTTGPSAEGNAVNALSGKPNLAVDEKYDNKEKLRKNYIKNNPDSFSSDPKNSEDPKNSDLTDYPQRPSGYEFKPGELEKLLRGKPNPNPNDSSVYNTADNEYGDPIFGSSDENSTGANSKNSKYPESLKLQIYKLRQAQKEMLANRQEDDYNGIFESPEAYRDPLDPELTYESSNQQEEKPLEPELAYAPSAEYLNKDNNPNKKNWGDQLKAARELRKN